MAAQLCLLRISWVTRCITNHESVCGARAGLLRERPNQATSPKHHPLFFLLRAPRLSKLVFCLFQCWGRTIHTIHWNARQLASNPTGWPNSKNQKEPNTCRQTLTNVTSVPITSESQVGPDAIPRISAPPPLFVQPFQGSRKGEQTKTWNHPAGCRITSNDHQDQTP